MTQPSAKSRWSFEVDKDLNRRLDKLVPYGLKSALFRAVVEMLADSMEKHGKIILGAVIAGEVELRMKRQKDA